MPSVTIQGHAFNLDDKYTEGHPLTANEAAAINQLRAENLRNNFASSIKDAKAALNEGVEDEDSWVDISDWTSLEAEFAKYADEYEFGARRGGGRVTDPLQREARRLARELVEANIRQKHGSLSAVDKDSMNETIDQVAANPKIIERAQANLDAAKELAGLVG